MRSSFHHLSRPPSTQWEIIKLTNTTRNDVDLVKLNIYGPFKIKELYEHKYENKLKLSMSGCETKELFIMLNKEVITNRSSTFYEGCITCSANRRVQQSVYLKALVFVPKIILKLNEVTLFINNVEGENYIELTNMGDVPAIYKWKKLNEERRYISQEDDIPQTASIILSDLISMLELETVNIELDSETNMTRRYQKYRCLLKDSNDSNDVKKILNEIIDDLDLNTQRYKLCYQDPLPIANYIKAEAERCKHDKSDDILSQLDESFDTEILQLQERLEEQLNKKQLNLQNFESTSELTSAAGKSSSTESCVCSTLNDILGHLKLEDSFEVLSLASSETCEPRSTVYFFKKCGLLQEKQKEMCIFHIPAIRKGFEVRAMFQLDVVGGTSQQLEITLVNLDETVALNKQHVCLGLKPWYERYQTKSFIENTTNYQLSLKLNNIPNNLNVNLPKIASGFNNILGKKMFRLPPFQTTIIRTEGIMGFNEQFKHEISITVNESEEKILKIVGHGTMPLLILFKPTLPFMESRDPYEVIEEYRSLQKIYYFEMFKTFNEKTEEFKSTLQEVEQENSIQEGQNFLPNLTLFSTETEYKPDAVKSSIDSNRELQILKILQTYVLVNNNGDLPNCIVLEQLLQAEKFLNHLRYISETASLLNKLYTNYLLHLKTYDIKHPINLKHFTIQSLPFQLRTNILDMGKVYINQYCKFVITLVFIGPGKLIAAARTAIKIPGLMIDFQILENDENNDYIYYRAEDNVTLCLKSYRNINERSWDGETCCKVNHAHSFDFNDLQQHQRVVTVEDTKCHWNYYNSLCKSIYLEQKNHFTHCKISTNTSTSEYTPSKRFDVIILFRPQKCYYKHNQYVEDYLYIDLHMGPTFPILLKALIIDRDQKDD